ncbi:hypothetical protein AURDEDRAFT_167051 [Auricularia subglabra TFB-10046 SS5]|nr:hypothetical protein AURDEDRAFT_167051 [Auricularia subglabra TFB-10046 SS5]
MTFTSSAGRLPVEILSMIADHLDIQHLLTFSHVCGRWNAVARAHPIFWRNIRLAAVTDSALEFFQARIAAVAGRGLYLDVCLGDRPLCDGIKNIVIPSVTRTLGHVVQLGLDMHSTTAPHVIPALSRPAPLLESMGLQFFYLPKERPAVMLPPNLLAGTCPRLYDLALANVAFPAEPVPVFQRVRSMTYHFGYRRVIPAGMFDPFPALQNLIIMGSSRLRVESTDGPAPSPTIPPLDELELCLPRRKYDPILASFPNLATARHILCRRPLEHVARQLVDQLHGGPLDLNFLCLMEDFVHITLHELPTNRVRSIVEHEKSIVEYMPRGVLFAPHLLERYETLRIFAQLGHLAPHIEPLPRCRTLEIILDFNMQSPIPNLEDDAPLRLPELCTVVVGNGEEQPKNIMTVDAALLRTYLSQLLGVRPKRPLLRLHGVTVAGDKDDLFRNFESASS